MNFRGIFVTLFVTASCGGSPCDGTKCLAGQVCDAKTGLCSSATQPVAKNGSRLRVRVWKGDDGTQLPAGFFDTARNEACGPALAEDGITRCLPTSTYENRSASQFFYFADASCSVHLVALTASDCTAPAYLALSSSACGVGASYQPLSAIAAPAAVYANQTGSCVQQPNVPAATQWLQAGASVPSSAFVAVTLE
jgi:hypothetical protein